VHDGFRAHLALGFDADVLMDPDSFGMYGEDDVEPLDDLADYEADEDTTFMFDD